MSKGRFVNEKLGKIVNRGIERNYWKARTQDRLQENKRIPARPGNSSKTVEDTPQTEESGDEK